MSGNLSDLVKRYTIRHHNKIKKICDPLDRLLGIPMFAHYTIEEDGRFGVVCNYPEDHEQFFGEKLYLKCPYLTHPSLFRSGHALISSTSDSNSPKKTNGPNHLFLIMKKLPTKIEGFFFSAPDLKPSKCMHIFNQIDLLNKFALYFKREAQGLLSDISDEGYNLHQAKGDAFLSRDSNLPLSNTSKIVQQFLSETEPLKLPLSKRENEVTREMLNGYPASEIAKILSISQRTVEHHLERIKDRLGSDSKSDLIQKLRELEAMGYRFQ